MSEIIEHGVDGLKVYPGDPHSLAVQITTCLKNEHLANTVKENAMKKIDQYYHWQRIAEQTVSVYMNILKDKQPLLLEGLIEAAAARS